MKTTDVFVKTAKGAEEIDKRTYQLDFKHRSALIPINGRSSVELLLPKILGDGMVLLESLLQDGFIAPASPGAVEVAPSASSPALGGTKTPLENAFNLDTAKMTAARKVEALLGPDGEALAMSIEGAKSHVEFISRATRTKDIIQQMRGAARADEFWKATGL